MRMTQILMNKPVYLGLSILDLGKTVMYEFWYDYIKPKYGENTKICYMDTDSFIVHVKTDDFYKDIGEEMIFTKSLQRMLKQDLKLQILKETGHCLKEKIKR